MVFSVLLLTVIVGTSPIWFLNAFRTLFDVPIISGLPSLSTSKIIKSLKLVEAISVNDPKFAVLVPFKVLFLMKYVLELLLTTMSGFESPSISPQAIAVPAEERATVTGEAKLIFPTVDVFKKTETLLSDAITTSNLESPLISAVVIALPFIV